MSLFYAIAQKRDIIGMKMKLPFTEEFLWTLYNMIEGLDEAYDIFAPKSFKDVLCPELFKLKRYYQRKSQRKSFSRFIGYLKKRGYLRYKRIGNKEALVLTPKGLKKISRISAKVRKLSERKDGKLQMIMYDIPEERKKDRNYFRRALVSLGYSKLQKSIWISPYDVFQRTERLVHDYDLEDFVQLFLIEEKL